MAAPPILFRFSALADALNPANIFQITRPVPGKAVMPVFNANSRVSRKMASMAFSNAGKVTRCPSYQIAQRCAAGQSSCLRLVSLGCAFIAALRLGAALRFTVLEVLEVTFGIFDVLFLRRFIATTMQHENNDSGTIAIHAIGGAKINPGRRQDQIILIEKSKPFGQTRVAPTNSDALNLLHSCAVNATLPTPPPTLSSPSRCNAASE